LIATSAPAIAASPARVAFAGAASRKIVVRSSGATLVVDVTLVGGAAPWLAARPRHFRLRPGEPVAVTVFARPRSGKRSAVIYLSGRALSAHGLHIRVRVGVRVAVAGARRRVFAGRRG
jgi:hypothetical protein